MKKLVTLFLALALCMGLAVPAFAASTETIDGVTITNVVRKETKTVPFIEYDENYNQSIVEKAITIYYIADGAVITTNDGFAGNYGYTLFNGAYEQGAGGQIGETGTWTEHQSNSWADFYELIADTTDQKVFYAFDGTEIIGEVVSSETPSETPADPEPTTPVQPEQPSEPVEEPAEEPPVETVTPEGAVTYTVQKGDTLGFITTNYYGNNAQRNALYRANADAFAETGGQLLPGMTLVIPATLGGVERLSCPAAGEGETLYTVKAGDSLSKIALDVYGDMWRYEDIFQRNSDRLKHANTIYEGQILVLPAK